MAVTSRRQDSKGPPRDLPLSRQRLWAEESYGAHVEAETLG